MNECEKLAQCPVWDKFNSNLNYVWINNYCKGPRRERCARLQLLRAGKLVAIDLLPNGTQLSAPNPAA